MGATRGRTPASACAEFRVWPATAPDFPLPPFPPLPLPFPAAFPAAAGSALAAALAAAFAPGAEPEDADVVFTLSVPAADGAGPGAPVAVATLSLRDLVADGADAVGAELPLAAAAGYAAAATAAGAAAAANGVTAGSTTVADLDVSVTGWRAVRDATRRA